MIKEAGVYNNISQAYAGLDSNKAVGVMVSNQWKVKATQAAQALIRKQGDKREYGYIIILRAVVTTDFMTAEAYDFEPALLKRIATRIVNEVDGVSRVVYDMTSKPPGTIELE